VRKDVYDMLTRDRRPGESYTRAILRLLQQRGPLEELFGAWGPAPSVERRRWQRLRGMGGSRR
jgi:predicted CopG family antitoxin